MIFDKYCNNLIRDRIIYYCVYFIILFHIRIFFSGKTFIYINV